MRTAFHINLPMVPIQLPTAQPSSNSGLIELPVLYGGSSLMYMHKGLPVWGKKKCCKKYKEKGKKRCKRCPEKN